jgi:hypothetical protein
MSGQNPMMSRWNILTGVTQDKSTILAESEEYLKDDVFDVTRLNIAKPDS